MADAGSEASLSTHVSLRFLEIIDKRARTSDGQFTDFRFEKDVQTTKVPGIVLNDEDVEPPMTFHDTRGPQLWLIKFQMGPVSMRLLQGHAATGTSGRATSKACLAAMESTAESLIMLFFAGRSQSTIPFMRRQVSAYMRDFIQEQLFEDRVDKDIAEELHKKERGGRDDRAALRLLWMARNKRNGKSLWENAVLRRPDIDWVRNDDDGLSGLYINDTYLNESISDLPLNPYVRGLFPGAKTPSDIQQEFGDGTTAEHGDGTEDVASRRLLAAHLARRGAYVGLYFSHNWGIKIKVHISKTKTRELRLAKAKVTSLLKELGVDVKNERRDGYFVNSAKEKEMFSTNSSRQEGQEGQEEEQDDDDIGTKVGESAP